ncbi:MAG TPA: Crp/Fnr family transcriptional regulator [Terriglobales bacterium]|nr:Crp/Fnr family transcriptional regulator [Terriglobales bacterium]
MAAKLSTKPRKVTRPSSAGEQDRAWFAAPLNSIPRGRSTLHLRKGSLIYSQGQQADAVYFIRQGKVRLSVLSRTGKEAILGILAPGDFCGEGCLAGQALRFGTATAITTTVVVKIQKAELVRALHQQHPLSEAFLAQLLARNIAIEEDICDQLFNHSEKRLARALLKLAHFGNGPVQRHGYTITPRISQEALAEMVGTTRGRVNFFMNKFRRLGLIDYKGEVTVHPELLTDVVLSD